MMCILCILQKFEQSKEYRVVLQSVVIDNPLSLTPVPDDTYDILSMLESYATSHEIFK